MNKLAIRSKIAYIRSSDSLHYIDVINNQCIEISLNQEQRQRFDLKYKSYQNTSRTLTIEELQEITDITGHVHGSLDFDMICLWVPASIHHEIEENYSYTVYGGVQIAGSLNRLSASEGLLSQRVFSQLNATIPGSAQLAHNKRIGDTFRDQIASSFQAMGYQVRKEVHYNTPFGGRRVDIEVSRNGSVLGNIETKSGNARYSSAQKAKDEWIRMTTGYSTTVVRNK